MAPTTGTPPARPRAEPRPDRWARRPRRCRRCGGHRSSRSAPRGPPDGRYSQEPVAKRKASDVFVECLEAEGVKHVFGIPGEETLDLNESLSRSSIEFIPVRHEQGGAYMADVWGRLTGRAGRLPRHARPGRAQPGHRRRGRVPRPCAARGAHRPGRPRADAQGVAPVHRPAAGDAPDHEVERARAGPGRSSPRSCARRSRWPRARSPAPPTSSFPRT